MLIPPFFSLVATIHKIRPDLLATLATHPSEAIPEAAPPHWMEKAQTTVEGIGEPITACFLTNTEVDPKNWLVYAFLCCANIYRRWIFEKYDGLRGFWNPLTKQFYSRRGHVFPVPQQVIDTMPSDMFLDGEMWYEPHTMYRLKLTNLARFGRGTFHEALRLARKLDSADIDWQKFKFMVFDIPNHTGTYEERYSTLGRCSYKGCGQC